jgi:hypothetical protein
MNHGWFLCFLFSVSLVVIGILWPVGWRLGSGEATLMAVGVSAPTKILKFSVNF